MKIKQVLESDEGINALLSVSLPVKTAYKLAKLGRKFNNIIKDIKLVNNNKIKEHGEEIVIEQEGKEPIKTGRFQVKPENTEKFQKEMEALLEEEAEIDIPDFNLSELEGNKIESKHLIALDWLIKE